MIGSVSPAAGAVLSCGQTITQSTVLENDVGPCPSNGIIIGADNITLDLNGHRVFGTPAAGDGAGVLVDQRRAVTVMRGLVTDFDGGVVIRGGGGNTVVQIVAERNLGASEGHPPSPGTLYGDGIAIQASSDNHIVNNVARNNGPFSGIGIFEVSDTDHPFPSGPAERNLVQGNVVEDNVECRRNPRTGTLFCDNDGIRLEPQVGPGNVVTGNAVNRNGLDGISLFADADGNTVSRNSVDANGFRGAVRGDGIRVFSSRNTVEDNHTTRNAAAGVSVGRRTGFPLGTLPPNSTTGNPRGQFNRLLRNVGQGNQVVDLWDGNPNCDANVWQGNSGTRNQPCIG